MNTAHVRIRLDKDQALHRLPGSITWLFPGVFLLLWLVPTLLCIMPANRVLAAPAKDQSNLASQPTVSVRSLELEGNTVLSPQDYQPILDQYRGRTVSGDELQEAARKLTMLYIDKGYVSSGVIVPDQAISDGIITLRAVEGRLGTTTVSGNTHFTSSYFTSRIERAAGTPVNVEAVRQALVRFEQDPRIEYVHASLQPGVSPGESTLDLDIKEKPVFRAGVDFGNTNPPTMGEWRGLLHATHTNLTGSGDILNLEFGGAQQFFENPKFFQTDLSYSRPITVYDTLLRLRYARYQSTITESPFAALDIESNTNLYQITLAQPIYRRDGRSLSLGLTGDYRNNMTYVSGQPFALSEGSDNGKTAESVLRVFQEYVDQNQNRVFALYSSFNFGIDALDATTSGSPNGRFFSWTGQGKWLQRLFQSNWQLFVRTDMQLTDNHLLDIEKFSVGGLNSVRGYRENRLVRDNGASGTVELRVPLLTDYAGHSLQLVPFYDIGDTWNSRGNTTGQQTIASAGGGLRWQFKDMISLQFYKAFPFTAFHDSKVYLQDLGYHFQLSTNITF